MLFEGIDTFAEEGIISNLSQKKKTTPALISPKYDTYTSGFNKSQFSPDSNSQSYSSVRTPIQKKRLNE